MAQANFEIIKGDTFLKSVTFRVKGTNSPVVITGATVAGVVKKTSTTSLTCVIVNGALGQFTFGLSSVQTAALETGINQIEVQITFADSTVKTLITGNLVVKDQL